MVIPARALFGAFFLANLVFPWATASAEPPVEAFGNLPVIADAQVSPDGKRLALLQSAQGKMVATIYTIGAPAGTRPVVFPPFADGKIRNIKWADNDRLLIWISMTYKYRGDFRKYETWRIVSFKVDGSSTEFLFKGENFNYVINSPALLSTLPSDPSHILMMQWDMDRYHTGGRAAGERIEQDAFRGISVYKVNVNDGRQTRVEEATEATSDWIIDSSETVRIRIDEDEDHAVIFARGANRGPFTEIARYSIDDPRHTPGFWGFGADPNKIYVTARRDGDRRGVYAFNLTTGQIGEKIFLHDLLDVTGGLLRDWHTDRIVGTRYINHMHETVYWDATYSALQKRMQILFKDKTIFILSVSRNREAVTLLVEAPGIPGTYYFYDAGKGLASPLANGYPALKPADLGLVKPISYQARDGLPIPAYLTLPPGREARNLPLVVLPHGGPQARDDQSFDWWASFYASRGYAVLQPNFRGSSGYGHNFVQAGYGEFGGKMQDDLTDGVRHLTAEGIADPKRVCIVGGSYGGYAALAGAAFTPEVYACAVSVNGVSDLPNMMGEQVRRAGRDTEAFNLRYWQRWLGNRYTDRDKMKAASPARNAGNVRAPILLIHGKDDTVVKFSQSKLMADALQKAGKPHRLISLEGEDHWLSQGESRIRVLKETEAFLKEHIGG